ncbi:MAG: TIGR02757 family protein [Planctomycetota bacterium]|nr:TIGR02757 family protein [Planctomycetota bacterium]
MPLLEHAGMFEGLYCDLNRRGYVHPDPLEFLYDYNDPSDREIVGLIAGSLAHGRVVQILKSVQCALRRMESSPAHFLRDASEYSLKRNFVGFRHRFSTGENLTAMLMGVKRVIERYGSLRDCFASALNDGDETVLPALSAFAKELGSVGRCGHLLPDPSRRSACKRLNLFLRWMVRCDEVDPGGWDAIPAAKLIIPLDTHMHRIGLALGATRRKTADMRTALEITDAFRRISPDDPVRYDFALTRLGIRSDMDLSEFLELCTARMTTLRSHHVRKSLLRIDAPTARKYRDTCRKDCGGRNNPIRYNAVTEDGNGMN